MNVGGMSDQPGWFAAAVASNGSAYPSVVSAGVDVYNDTASGTGSSYATLPSDSVWVVLSWGEGSAITPGVPPIAVTDDLGQNLTLAKELLQPDYGAQDNLALYYHDDLGSASVQVSFHLQDPAFVAMATLVISGAARPSFAGASDGGFGATPEEYAGGPTQDTLSTHGARQLVFYFLGGVAGGMMESGLAPAWIPGAGLSMVVAGGNPGEPGSTLGVFCEEVPAPRTVRLTATFATNLTIVLGAQVPENASIYVEVASECPGRPTVSVQDGSGDSFVDRVASSFGNASSLYAGALELWAAQYAHPAQDDESLTVTNYCAFFSSIVMVASGPSTPLLDRRGTGGLSFAVGTLWSTVRTDYPNETLLLLAAVETAGADSGMGASGSAGSTVVGVTSPYDGGLALAAFSLAVARPGLPVVRGAVSDSGSTGVAVFWVGMSLELAPLVPLVFIERGLSTGLAWGVTIWNVTHSAIVTVSTGTAVDFVEPIGPVALSVIPPAGYGLAAISGRGNPGQTQGRLTGPTAWQLWFGPLETLFFNETLIRAWDLPGSMTWGVDLTPFYGEAGPTAQHSINTTYGTLGSVRFTVPSGAIYRYTISAPPGYGALSGKGTLKVPLTADRSSTHLLAFRAVRSALVPSSSGPENGFSTVEAQPAPRPILPGCAPRSALAPQRNPEFRMVG